MTCPFLRSVSFQCLLMGVAVLVLAASARADIIREIAEERFGAAQEVFESVRHQFSQVGSTVEVREQFHAVAAAFAEQAHDGWRTLHLYINTGNAYYFAGEPARALLWYRRAVELENSAEARSGLASLRRICDVRTWPRPETTIQQVLMSWHTDVSSYTKQWVVLATYLPGIVCVLIGLSVTRRRRLWSRIGLGLMAVGLVMGISDVVQNLSEHDRWAVVMSGVAGRAGNGAEYSVTVPTINAGQEVKVHEQRAGWLRIELPGETTCWIPDDQAEMVKMAADSATDGHGRDGWFEESS